MSVCGNVGTYLSLAVLSDTDCNDCYCRLAA